jgi:PAS domain S-box-containing protein
MINSDLKQLVDKIDYIFYVKTKDENNRVIWANEFTLNLVSVSSVEDLNAKLKSTNSNFAYAFLFENDIGITEPVSRLYYYEKNGNDDNLVKQKTFFLTKIPDFNNDPAALICFGNEITDSLTSINRVEFFKQLLNSTNDALILTEVTHPFRILFANKGFLRLSGYKSLAEVLGKSPTELVGKSSKDDKTRDIFNDSLKKNNSAFAVFENYKRNDHKYPYKNAIKVIPLFDQNNQLQYFLSIQEDVTEKEKLKLQTQLQQNKLKAIFNATESFLWLLDARGKIVELNKTAKLQSRDHVNTDISFADCRWWKSNDESRVKIDDALTSVIRKRKDIRTKADILLANDETKVVDIAFRAIRANNGDLLFIVVEAHDVTELENQRQRALDLAKENKSAINLTDDQIDNYVKGDIESTREDLIRLTKTETVLNQQVIPQLNQLTEVVLDPKEGLAVMAQSNAKALSSIKDDMSDLKQMKEFANLGMQLIGWTKKPFFKWLLLALVASTGFSSVKFLSTSISDFVDYQMQQQQSP